MNILYIIPNLKKVSGGPKTRISLFKKVFIKNGNKIIEKGNKLKSALVFSNIETVYVESATNRISLVDFFSLLILKVKSEKIIVFIRDIYIELFPEEYRSFRGKITLFFNKISNLFLSMIATKIAFPTKEMGFLFFQKNKFVFKKPYFGLPPGTTTNNPILKTPNFSKKIGLLYLGSISYKNAGFNHFLNFSEKYKNDYNYFVLSGDINCNKYNHLSHIQFSKIMLSEIPNYILEKNIAFAFHTRPRNKYDDITFPIKVLDFISFNLPFFTEKHIPLVDMLGEEYLLFVSIENYTLIHNHIQKMIDINHYQLVINSLKKIVKQNIYSERYKQILQG